MSDDRNLKTESPSNEREDDGSTHDDRTVPGKTSQPPEGEVWVKYVGRSDVGLVREHNEDNFVTVDLGAGIAHWGGDGEEANAAPGILRAGVSKKGIVLGVCDGMGGAAAGEVASRMATETIREIMVAGGVARDRDMFAHRLVYAIEEAGSRIFGAAKMDRSRRGMGTTATLAGLIDRVLFVGQVGDSRCYVLRQGKLALVTKDQSLVNQLIEAGQLTEEEAEAFEHSNIILQALGTTEEVTVDLTFFELRRGDRILVCSDGLSGLVHSEMIAEALGTGDDLIAICTRLIEMANAGGGHDNITCVVAEFGGDGLAAPMDAAVPAYQQYPLPPPPQRNSDTPSREFETKAMGKKPGADVKGRTSGGFPWLWALGLFVVGLGLVLLWPRTPAVNSPEPAAVPEEPLATGELCVRTDVPEARIVVDGTLWGPVVEGQEFCRSQMLPGAYRFEARSNGSVAVSEMVQLAEGERKMVELRLPMVAADAELPAVDEADPGVIDAEEPPPPASRPTPVRPAVEPMQTVAGTMAVVAEPAATVMTPTTMTPPVQDTTSMTGSRGLANPRGGIPENPF